jgi:hypothetical protein
MTTLVLSVDQPDSVLLVTRGGGTVQATPVAGGGGGGNVVSVSGVAPIVITGTAEDPIVTITPATETAAGSMSAADKVKLDGTNALILGTETVGSAQFSALGTDWVTIGAGQTATLFTLPGGPLGAGEQASLAVFVDVQSVLPALTVTSASDATPVVLGVGSTTGLASGDRMLSSGILGNLAANGSYYYQVLDGSTLALFTDKALTVPVAGSGAYAGGGTVTSLSFGHFQQQETLRNMFGDIINSLGSVLAQDVTLPVPPGNVLPSLTGASVAIALASGSIVVTATAPTTTPMRAGCQPCGVRRAIPPAGPPPVLTSTSVGSGPSYPGGTPGVLTGLHFTGAIQVTLDGVPATFAVVNDTTIDFVSGQGPAFGGTGDILVTTLSGTSNALAGAWTYIESLGSIFSDIMVGWYEGDSLTEVSNVVTGWLDKRVTSPQDAVVGAGSAGPVYVPASANFNGEPTVILNGLNDFLVVPAFDVGGTTPQLFFIVGARLMAESGGFGGALIEYDAPSVIRIDYFPAAGARMTGAGSGNVNEPTSALDLSQAVYGFADATVNPTALVSISVDNAAPLTTTNASLGTLNLQKLLFGCHDETPGTFCNVELAFAVVCDGAPTSPQLAAAQALIAAKWGA